MNPILSDLGQGLLDAVFPPTCVHCGALVEPGAGFSNVCADCVAALHFVKAPACECCGHPFFGVVHGERICPHCDGLDPAFNRGVSTLLFKGPARSLVLGLKYHRGVYLENDLEEIFRRSPRVLAFLGDAEVVPVPLHPRKLRERGYNQAEFIAKALLKAAGRSPLLRPVLERDVDTGTQTLLDKRSRLRNLRSAFRLAKACALDKGKRHVLVDDVFTTGATLNGCASVLRRAGVESIDVLTLAHG